MTISWHLLGKRAETMRTALERAVPDPLIVETGCVRGPSTWSGDGMSTLVFWAWGGTLYSVDIDPEAVEQARRMAPGATFTVGDSVAYLAAFRQPIDLLYLDSLDYPDGPLRDIYGGKEDIHAAIATLDAMGEDAIVERHGDLILPSQQHCLAELEAAWPRLHERSVVVIDDAGLPGGGKARLAKRALASAGWRCIADAYQTVWAL